MSATKPTQATLKSYLTGYILSLVLTITAYVVIRVHGNAKWTLVAIVVSLAMIQFIVQLLYFLHLGRETKPRWKLGVFAFMLMVVIILVFGSLWIMNNLNYRMTPQQMQNYMNAQTGF